LDDEADGLGAGDEPSAAATPTPVPSAMAVAAKAVNTMRLIGFMPDLLHSVARVAPGIRNQPFQAAPR
jgi:hypothetical protein